MKRNTLLAVITALLPALNLLSFCSYVWAYYASLFSTILCMSSILIFLYMNDQRERRYAIHTPCKTLFSKQGRSDAAPVLPNIKNVYRGGL